MSKFWGKKKGHSSFNRHVGTNGVSRSSISRKFITAIIRKFGGGDGKRKPWGSGK